MARWQINRLTALSVKARRGKPGLHADGAGLYLAVSASGAASWIYRWKRDGRLRDMGLGPLGDPENPTVDLAEARRRAAEARRMVERGGDPIAARRETRTAAKLVDARAMTFKQCAEAYIAAHRAGWKSVVHAAQWPATLEAYVYPIFGDLAVQAIDVGLVMKALEPVWQTRTETASRVRGRIENVLDWARARGYRQGDNPARWRGHLENLLPKKSKVARVEHLAALPYLELPDFMIELRRQESAAARALEFAILTTARTGEVIGATWSEIDLEARQWTVPAERMKAGREHRGPLSDAAVAVLGQMAAIRQGEFVFPGGRAGRPLSSTAMLMTLRRMGRVDLTVHGFRSSFSTWAIEQTNFPTEAREMALAHTVGTAVERAYQRSDLFEKRRQLAEAWSQFCAMPASDDDARVVAIGRVRG